MGQNPPVMVDDLAETLIWEGTVRGIGKRRKNLREGLIRAYATIWDQSLPVLRGKIKELPEYTAISQAKDPVRLLEEIRNAICGRQVHQQPCYLMVQLIKMLTQFFFSKQTPEK